MTGPWGAPPPGPPPRRYGGFVAGVAFCLVILLLMTGGWNLDAWETQRILIAVVVGGSLTVMLAYRLRGRFSQGLIFAGAWAGIALVIAVFWVLRNDLREVGGRLMMAVMPGGADWMPGVVKVPADRSGHFVVEGLVDGVSVRFIVDTGATGVSLGARDAERVGFKLGQLDYSGKARTASGVVAVAPVRLGEISIGSIRVGNVAATVNPKMEDMSLLGMSFLSRLSGFAVEDGALILRQ